MKILGKILTAIKPSKLITKVYKIHKESSVATKVIGLAYALLLSALLIKEVITVEDFIEILNNIIE